jgi:2-aminobenzoate-CoA ligase
MSIPGNVPSGHDDGSVRELLPPRELWPVFDYSAPHLAGFPDQLNAAEQLIDRAVALGFGDKTAIHHEGVSWTYRHLLDRARRIARVLSEDLGLVPGNRVLLRGANSPMLAASWLGVLKAGGICVTTMPLLRAQELRFILDRVQVRIALCEAEFAEELEAARPHATALEHAAYFTPAGDGVSRGSVRQDADLDRRIEGKPGDFSNVATAASDIALICFTSGTTGNPKAAAHAHRDVIAISECYPRVYTVDSRDVVCGSPSVAFSFGLGGLLVSPLRHGATIVFTPRPAPDQILRAVERHGVTSLYAVPTSYRGILDELDRPGYDIRSLRKCSSAGEDLQLPLFEQWHQRTAIRMVNGIGATEMLNHFLSDTLSVERPGSTGKPVPGYTVRLTDDEGREVPRGSMGKLSVRGPTGCLYLDDVERQSQFVQGGWNVTGDLFEEDDEGYFWFVDRADDLIVSSGYNISPREVERAILDHPAVKECAAVGVPDDKRGKVVRACVVLHDWALGGEQTASELQAFVKSRIAPYKYPRRIDFLESLPRTGTGKIQRYLLRSV